MHNIQLILLVSVIFFTSLAYGGVLTWTKGILELTALLIGLTTIIIFVARNKKWPIKLSPLNITIFCFAGLIFLQLIPLPNIFLRYFSATTVTLQENHNFATISLYNFATLENLLLLISYLVIYFFTLCCAYNLKTQRQISWSIYLLGCTVAIFGLIQYLIPLQIIGFYAKQWTFNGVCGTFISQTNFAALMELTIPLGLGLFITRPKQTSVKINLKQLYCFSGIVIMVLALFLTTSRIGIISFFFSLLLMSTVAKLSGDKSKWFVIAIIFFALALLLWIGVDPVSRRFSLEAIRHEFIQGDRIQIWQANLNMVKSFPVFGVGWGNYGYVFPIYTPPHLEAFYRFAHNEYLHILAEVGLAGLLLFLSGIYFWTRTILRKIKITDSNHRGFLIGILGSVSANLFHALGDFNFHIPAIGLIMVVLAGLGIASKPDQSPDLPVNDNAE